MTGHPHVSWIATDKVIKDYLWDSISRASRYAQGNLLDIGCGQKPYSEIFNNKVKSYIGLDLRDDHADLHGSALALPFKANRFDTVVSFQVLEHVPDPFLMIREAARVLKTGGYLILTAPLFGSIHEEPDDYFRFTKYGLRVLVENAGLKVIYIEEQGNWPSNVGHQMVWFLESTGNKTILKYPKKIVQILVNYFSWKLSGLAIFTKNKKAPINYLLVAQK